MYKKIIEDCIKDRKILPLDIATGLAFDPCRGSVFVTIVFLSAAFRSGHLFVDISDVIEPSVSSIWGIDGEAIEAVIRDGFALVSESNSIVKSGTRLYFERAYRDEQEILRHINRLQARNIEPSYVHKMELLLLQARADNQLTAAQAKALHALVDKSIGMIAGGPGTGKTYTAGVFLKAFYGSFSNDDQKKIQIALAGPTGKAAQNLKKSIEIAFGAEYVFVEQQVEVKTLHSLLKLSRFSSFATVDSPLPYHLIIVDEASMIDASLMKKLLSRIKVGTRLLFLGDPNQLPSVEPGAVFQELVQKNILPGSTLTECLRCDLAPIINFASAIKEGNDKSVFECMLQTDEGIISFHPWPADDLIFVKKYKEYFKEVDSGRLEDMAKFRLLCPLKEGACGASQINELLFQASVNKDGGYCPVIISKNDYELNLMNGQMGLMSMHKHRALFLVDGQVKCFPLSLLPQYDFGFCLSVHKSQGSEFDHVVLLLPPGSEKFGRKMLYTAVTRARKKIDVYGERETIMKLVSSDEKKMCNLLKEI